MKNRTINRELILEKMQDDINCGKFKKLIFARFSILAGFRCEILEWEDVYV